MTSKTSSGGAGIWGYYPLESPLPRTDSSCLCFSWPSRLLGFLLYSPVLVSCSMPHLHRKSLALSTLPLSSQLSAKNGQISGSVITFPLNNLKYHSLFHTRVDNSTCMIFKNKFFFKI